MLSNLYRAYVGARDGRDAVVFFEEPVWRDARSQAEALTSLIWEVPAEELDVYHVCSADELLRQAFGRPETGDLRLFENGWADGAPSYVDPDSVLLLVISPALYSRLRAAQSLLPRLRFGLRRAA